MKDNRPVLIVGAGPTGLTAAMELSRFGVDVRIVDKLSEPSTTSRALAVQARTLELLAQRGLTEEMLRLGNQGHAATLYGNHKRLGKVHLSEIQSRYNYILLLSQAETERILRDQLARQGVAIERNTEMIAFGQSESSSQPGQNGGVRAVLRHADGSLEELESSYMISAEGAHSTARHTLNLEFVGRAVGESYALADLHLDGSLPDDELSIFLGEHGFLAAFPLGNRRFRLIATDPEPQADPVDAPTLESLQSLYDTNASVPARLHDMVWSSRFRINSRMLHTLQEGRVFFGGDAAHIHSPAGGQGMNTGIQDMLNLGWKLAMVVQGKAAPALLDTYAQDRLPVIESVVTKTETATDAFISRSTLVHQLITHIAPVLLDTQFAQHLSTGLISEVAANYRPSRLSENHHAIGDLRGGDRVPDLDVLALLAEPCETYLHDILDPSGLTLLIANGAGLTDAVLPWPEPLKPWQDILTVRQIAPSLAKAEASAQFDTLFGTRQNLFVVRPDSYLGFVGRHDALPALAQWLGRWFPTD